MSFPIELHNFNNNNWFTINQETGQLQQSQFTDIARNISQRSLWQRFKYFCGLTHDSDAKILAQIAERTLAATRLDEDQLPPATTLTEVFYKANFLHAKYRQVRKLHYNVRKIQQQATARYQQLGLIQRIVQSVVYFFTHSSLQDSLHQLQNAQSRLGHLYDHYHNERQQTINTSIQVGSVTLNGKQTPVHASLDGIFTEEYREETPLNHSTSFAIGDYVNSSVPSFKIVREWHINPKRFSFDLFQIDEQTYLPKITEQHKPGLNKVWIKGHWRDTTVMKLYQIAVEVLLYSNRQYLAIDHDDEEIYRAYAAGFREGNVAKCNHEQIQEEIRRRFACQTTLRKDVREDGSSHRWLMKEDLLKPIVMTARGNKSWEEIIHEQPILDPEKAHLPPFWGIKTDFLQQRNGTPKALHKSQITGKAEKRAPRFLSRKWEEIRERITVIEQETDSSITMETIQNNPIPDSIDRRLSR